MYKYALLFILTLILSACSSGISGTEFVEIEDACADVQCPQFSTCLEGTCSCFDGYKECNGACIKDSACCGDEDCGDDEVCEKNICKFSCDKVTCSDNKLCDQEIERCVCPKGYLYCESQKKCIPEDHCCDRFDCRVDERCLPTITSTEICLFENQNRFCKIIDERHPKSINTETQQFNITTQNFFYLKHVDLLVNNQSLRLEPGKSFTMNSDVDIAAYKMREKGGSCLDFDLSTES